MQSFPRTRNILVAKTEFVTLKNYVFFPQRTSIWHYKMQISDSILSTYTDQRPVGFSIPLDIKISERTS